MHLGAGDLPCNPVLFVVHLVGGDNPHPFKHFAARADAVAHGSIIKLGPLAMDRRLPPPWTH